MTKKTAFIFAMALGLFSCSAGQKTDRVVPELKQGPEGVEVRMNGEHFTTYRFDPELEKPILYPVYAPGTVVVTRGFPLAPREKERTDHPHHVGLWFNFGDVNGFDFWNNSYTVPENRSGHFGRVLHREIVRIESGKEVGILEVKMDWVAPDNIRAEHLLKEHTIYEFRGGKQIWMVDRITTLEAAADTVVFTDNKEGMLAIRVDRAFELPSEKSAGEAVPDNEGVNGWYRNSRGDEGPNAWGKNAEWVKLTGTQEGKSSSIVIMDHPGNLNFPACWHARGYGLFSINNLGRKVYNRELEIFRLVLIRGETLTFRHRFLVASGDLSDAEIGAIYSDFTSE